MALATLDPKQAYRRDFVLAETMTAGTAGYCFNDAGVPKFAPATSTAALTPTDFGDRRRIQSAHILDTPADRGTIVVVYNSYEGADTGQVKARAIDLENEVEGTEVTISTDTGSVYFQVCSIDKANGKGFVSYIEDDGSYDTVRCVAFTVSGTTITLGSSIQISPATSDCLFAECIGVDTDTAMVIFRDQTAAYDHRVVAVTSTSGTGTTLTEQDDISFYNTTFANNLKICKVDTNKAAINYMANTYGGHCKIATYSGGSLSVGSDYPHDNPAYSGYDCVQVATNKFAIMYGRASDTIVRIGSVLGSAVSWGTRQTITAYVSYVNDMARFQDEDDQFAVIYRAAGSKTALRVCTVSGTAISLGEETTIADYAPSYVEIQGLDNDEFWFAWYEGSTTTCWYQTATGGVLSLGINRAIGVLEVSGNAGDTRNVTLLGGITESMSGLTPGARYWIQEADASLDTVESQFPFGIALETDEFFVFRGAEWGQ